MRILHLWKGTTARAGGGGLLMGQLHRGLLRDGVDSRVLAEWRAEGETPGEVALLPRWRVDGALRRVTRRVGLNDIHKLSSFAVASHPFVREADVVHVHGTHSDCFNYLALPALARHRPLLMTLHDMWAMTGHCADGYGCDRWRTGCGACPRLDANPVVARDATRLEWRLKRWALGRARPTLVTVSESLEAMVGQSFLAGLPVHRIANGVDTDTLRPLDPAVCRQRLGLPQDGHVVVFPAIDLGHAHKGGDLLLDALARLDPALAARVTLLLVGGNGAGLAARSPVACRELGFVATDADKAVAFGAADLMACPSRGESMGLVIAEAAACGRPAVGFEVTGVRSVVRDGVTGHLARPFDTAAFAAGLAALLTDGGRRRQAGEAARQRAVDEYSLSSMTQRYRQLYGQVAAAWHRPPQQAAEAGFDPAVHGPAGPARG